MPPEYQQVEYIQSTGNDMAQVPIIDTGYKPNKNTGLDIVYQSTSPSPSQYLVGSRTASLVIQYGLNGSSSHDYWSVHLGGQTTQSTMERSKNKFHSVLTPTESGMEWKIENLDEGTEYSTTISGYTVSTSAPSMYLFAFKSSDNSLAGLRIFACKIYDNGNIVRDFIPCYRRSDGVIGLYDLANKVFYTKSAGTKDFIKGADCSCEALPTLDTPQQIFNTGDDGIRLSLDGKEVNIPISLRYKDKLVIDFVSRQVYVNRHTALFTVRGEDVIAFAPPENGITQAIIKLPMLSRIISGSYEDIAYCTHATHEPSGKKILNTFYLYNLGKHFHIIFSDSITTISECREYIEELYASGTPIQLAYAVGEPYVENYSGCDFARELFNLKTARGDTDFELCSAVMPSTVKITYYMEEI